MSASNNMSPVSCQLAGRRFVPSSVTAGNDGANRGGVHRPVLIDRFANARKAQVV